MLLGKNLPFSSNQADIQATLPIPELVILTKSYVHAKIVDISVPVQIIFGQPISFSHTIISTSPLWFICYYDLQCSGY